MGGEDRPELHSLIVEATGRRAEQVQRRPLLPYQGGLAVGGTALAATGTHSPTRQPSAPASAGPQTVHVFARDARGQTYGLELDATDLGHAPDLIAAYATNGKLGYVLKQQLHPPGPANSAAALRAQAAAAKQAPALIPVYAVDGVTQIGVFQFAPAKG